MNLYKDLTRGEGDCFLSIYNSSFGIMRISEVMDRLKEKNGRVHIVGVLGEGLRGIAELLLHEGVRVSGSDMRSAEQARELIALGLEFFSGHSPTNVSGAHLLIYTLAISDNNSEYTYAREMGIPTVSRAEFSAYLASKAEKCITVAGSHGKSTITAMLAHIFAMTPDSASVLSGAQLNGGCNSQVGNGKFFIAEACEYKDSFLKFRPAIAIINNIELDHTDYFSDLGALEKSFVKYASNTQQKVLLNIDDAGVRSIKERINCSKALTYGTAQNADFKITNVSVGEGEYLFTLSKNGSYLGEFVLRIPGIFNVTNATAAIAAAYESGIDIEVIRRGVQSFSGISRRLEYIGEYKCRPVFYDYAHHPTEIYAGIGALRALSKDPLTVVFKPHTFSRTRDLWDGFIRSLSYADYVIIGDIYGAREEKSDSPKSEIMARQIGESARYSTDEGITETLDNFTRGAIVLMGAADMRGIIVQMKIKK